MPLGGARRGTRGNPIPDAALGRVTEACGAGGRKRGCTVAASGTLSAVLRNLPEDGAASDRCRAAATSELEDRACVLLSLLRGRSLGRPGDPGTAQRAW